MRINKAILAAGLALSAVTIGSAAQAQDYDHHDNHGYGRDYRDGRDDRDGRYDHDRGRHDGWERGRHYGRDRHRHCRTEWRYHHRVTVCR